MKKYLWFLVPMSILWIIILIPHLLKLDMRNNEWYVLPYAVSTFLGFIISMFYALDRYFKN